MTHMLVRRHRRLIARVAKALLEQTTLTGEELDRLIGRSVADVKPKPYLPVPAGVGDRGILFGGRGVCHPIGTHLEQSPSVPAPASGANAAGRGYALLANSASQMRSSAG